MKKQIFLCVAVFATFGVFVQQVNNVVETQFVMVNGYPQIETWKNNRYVPTTQW